MSFRMNFRHNGSLVRHPVGRVADPAENAEHSPKIIASLFSVPASLDTSCLI